jgi:hypothetical protein
MGTRARPDKSFTQRSKNPQSCSYFDFVEPVLNLTSVVRHADATLSRIQSTAGSVTFSRMSEALAVQMNGLGALL